ncbi:MAG: pyridoxal phosphate-dependent aminotransferase [Candidatus Moranbacteria bacterium]|nr:pyridoxal phosphate-dependent aminotransferase [Candidatus Moranbacteria bacterium]
MSNLILSPIKEMEIRASKISGVVSLAQGVADFDTPECIKRCAIEHIQNGDVAKYSLSPGIMELREVLEVDLAKKGIYYDFESEIIITAGAIEAITATLLTILNDGDEVLIPDPTYTSYQEAIKNAKGVPKFVPLSEKDGWSFDENKLERNITSKTRAILFCNPNNPTGTIYSKGQLMKILEIAEKNNLYVLADEVYRDFVYDNQDFYSIGNFSKFRNRIIYIFSFSKSYSMTGWRVGFLATEQSLAQKILVRHDVLVTCAPVVSQWSALAAIEMADEDMQHFKEMFNERRDLICSHLDGMRDWLIYQKPSSAYFVFPKFTKKLVEALENDRAIKNYDTKDYQEKSLSWKLALNLLYEAKIAVVPGRAFGKTGENHIRMCFGRSSEDILKVLVRMKDYFDKKYR